MRLMITAVLLTLSAGLAHASPACSTQAAEKKLAGAAKTSFVKKCARDTCAAQAKDKKLAGAAKTSFLKKCERDAAAPAAAASAP